MYVCLGYLSKVDFLFIVSNSHKAKSCQNKAVYLLFINFPIEMIKYVSLFFCRNSQQDS